MDTDRAGRFEVGLRARSPGELWSWFRYHRGTITSMDVSVKGLEPEIVERLSAQAEAEGVSAQEWMRQALRRAASLLTPRELEALVATRTAVDAERYAEIMDDLTARRVPPAAGGAPTGVRRRRR